MAVQPVPEGYTAVTPYLTIKNAAAAIEFYKKAFGAVEVMRMPMPDGRLMHAEITIAGAHVMLHDEMPEWGALGPDTRGGSASSIMLYVPNVDEVYQRAVAAGATAKMPVADQFYGDRCGNVSDPFGHQWTISTHIEDVPPVELKRRAEKFLAEQLKR